MRRVAVALLCGLAAAAPLRAQEEPSPIALEGPHLRPDSAELRALFADTADRSASFRQLLQRIEASDLIVYVRMRHFGSTRLEGRIGFAAGAAPGGLRILLVELACPRSAAEQAITLAHELHHATEIADAPWVTGTASLADYYRQIGEQTPPLDHGVSFETRAARDTAARVKRETATALKWSHEDH